MLESFQRLIGADATTARFLAAFIAALALLYLASLAYDRLVARAAPAPAKGAKAPLSPIQAAAKSAAVGFARFVAALPITPNQITVIGLLLVLFCSALFLWHQNTFVYGASLIAAYLFDTLDGVVARAQGTSSRFGGYLDAVIDRYQEVVTYLAIAWVTELWVVTFLVLAGSLLTSYNKARAAVETTIDNKGWPDLLEKPARLFILCTALIGATTLPWMLPVGLWALAVMTHFTGLQRMARAWFLIRATDGTRR